MHGPIKIEKREKGFMQKKFATNHIRVYIMDDYAQNLRLEFILIDLTHYVSKKKVIFPYMRLILI